MSDYEIVEVAGVDCDLIDAPWAFATEQADSIERNWAKRIQRTPELFNGPVLLLGHGDLQARPKGRPVLRGACFETDFKTFLCWRDLGFPAAGVRNCFAMAALETADGAFILGEMNAHTAPAGQIYFPSGTPDLTDVVDGKVDLDASAGRELREETGLDPDTLIVEPGMTLVMSDIRLCCMKRMRSPETAERLVDRIHAWLALDPKPELLRMHIVRNRGDLTPAMPAFVTAYIGSRLARR